MQVTWIQFLGGEDLLEKEITHSSIVWKIPWTEEPGMLQFMGSQRVGQDLATAAAAAKSLHQKICGPILMWASQGTQW